MAGSSVESRGPVSEGPVSLPHRRAPQGVFLTRPPQGPVCSGHNIMHGFPSRGLGAFPGAITPQERMH